MIPRRRAPYPAAVALAVMLAAPSLHAQTVTRRLPHVYAGIPLGASRRAVEGSAGWRCQGAGGVLMCNVNDSATAVVERDTITGVIVSGQLPARRTGTPSGQWSAAFRNRFAATFGRPDSVHVETDSASGPGGPRERQLQASWFAPLDSVAVVVTITVEQTAGSSPQRREPGLIEVSARCSPGCPRSPTR